MESQSPSLPSSPLPHRQVRRRLSLYLHLLSGFLRGAAGLAIAAGCLVLSGWIFDITLFKTLTVGTAAMRPLSAVMTILLGFSLVAFARRSPRPMWRRPGFWLGVVFSGFSVFSLLHTVFDWHLAIDVYLYRSSPDRALTNTYAGCAIFLTQAASLMLLWAGRFGASQVFALLSLCVTYFGLTGYLYDMSQLQKLGLFHSLSLPFLLIYTLTGIGLLASRPQRGLVRELISEHPGGAAARWLLPLGFLAPLAGGLVHVRNLRHALYGPSVALGLATLLTSLLFVAAVWLCAGKINHGHSHLRRRERLYAVLSECNQTIIRIAERPDLFAKICTSLVETGEFQAAWVAEASPSSSLRHSVVAARGLGAEALLGSDSFDLSLPASRILADGKRIDLDVCPGEAPWKRLAPFERPSALVLLPLRVEGRTEAVLVVHAARKHAFDADHLMLLDEVAGDVSHALDLIRERRVHRQAEQRLYDTAARLNEALAKNPTLFYSLHVSSDGVVSPEYVSENVNGILGYSVAEAMQPSWWTSHLHPDDVGRPHSLSVPPGDRNTLTRDFRFEDSDGSYVWIRDEQRVVRGARGEPTRLVGSWSDITERIHMEEQFRHAQKFESLGRLAGGVAHDLNNILTVVDGHASLLEATASEDPSSKESIDEILLATKRATRLTRQLLTFSKKQFIEPRNINLNAVIGDMGKMLKRTVGEDIEILFEGDPSLPAVFADEGMVEQILLNLVVNARDAMPKGGTIRLNTARARIERNHPVGSAVGGEVPAGDYVRFSVADTGCGIPPSHLAKIFDPFFTTKEPGKGTGLGLATVRSIVRQHGGTLTVTSEPDRGTTFHIYLPVATTISLAVPEKRGRLRKASEETEGAATGATILLVEDDEAVRSMMKSILVHMGHRVVEAPAAREAMEVYGQNTTGIDLLLTDVVLPGGLSGRDLAVHLRNIDPSLPVLYVTGYSVLPKEYGFGEEENRDFLRKPFASVDLIEKVRVRLAGVAKVNAV